MSDVKLSLDARLKDWATPRQAEYLDAVNLLGSARRAAEMMGINRRTIDKSIARLRVNAAAHGYSPEHGLNSPIAEPFIAKGHSTLERVAPDGSRTPVLQWTKTRLDEQRWIEAVKEGLAAFLEETPPVAAAAPPLDFDTDIIPWIQIGDAHLGLLCHAAEVNENFDLKIAERELLGAIGILIDELPNCERIVVNDLGDFTHYENFTGTTEASGHALDFDTRFPKMITVYSRVMRAIVDKALAKARYVDVIVNQGNHSRTNDIWMAELLRVAYGHTGRVNVLNNGNVFMGYRMGNTLVMTHHSDKCPPKRLVEVMITDFREDFGETEFHYIDIGHVHHNMVVKEGPSILLESWNHLAGTDKWAHDYGYRARKSISVVMRSRKYGEVMRRLLPIQEIRDKILGLPAGTSRLVTNQAFTV